MKLEVVITRWEDGLFKSRDIIEESNFDDLKVKFELLIEKLEIAHELERENKYKIAEDDDIPF